MARKHGLRSGWSEYRYGTSKRPITLAGRKPRKILRGAKREHVVDSIAALLKSFKLTPFEHEAACLQGLRSGFCLEGHRWPLANLEAEQIVAEALRRIGAERPTWEAGQREYTVPRENCRYCARPLDEEDIARNRLFCSPLCAKSALQYRDFEDGRWYDKLARSAYRLIQSERSDPRVCEHCGAIFRPGQAWLKTRFCSPRCARESLKLRELPCTCAWCEAPFIANRSSAIFCSDRCKVAGGRVNSGRVKKISPPVFDFITRRPASGFTSDRGGMHRRVLGFVVRHR